MSSDRRRRPGSRADGSLDFARSFERVDYPPLLASLSVRNNVQAAVGSHPIDFLAMRIPTDGIWLYAAARISKPLIQSRETLAARDRVALPADPQLHQDADGSIHYNQPSLVRAFRCDFSRTKICRSRKAIAHRPIARPGSTPGIPNQDWFRATHQTAYSNGIIALHEQFLPPLSRLTPTTRTPRYWRVSTNAGAAWPSPIS